MLDLADVFSKLHPIEVVLALLAGAASLPLVTRWLGVSKLAEAEDAAERTP